MAHSPVSRPDPFEPREPDRAFESKPDPAEEPVAQQSLSQYLNALVASGGGSLSTEVALDLVLNEIAQRACRTTGATGAAIALTRNGEMVCRATTGENAPDIGMHLSTSHGLSGACVRTGEWQRCDDTENDQRVDAEACRRLGVRSILVAPVRKAEEIFGVIEIFSTRPNAFGDREVRILEDLSREIGENAERAGGLQAPKPEPSLLMDSANLQSSESAIAAPDIPSTEGELPQRDLWTTALLVCVILLALILGWVVGRGGWRRATRKSVAPVSQAVQGQSEAVATDSSTIAATETPTRTAATIPVSGSRTATGDVAADEGLTVSRNGKVIFRAPSQGAQNFATGAIQPAGPKSTKRGPGLRISSEIAQEYLATRVEPEYPEQARKNRIQGPVVLDAWVSKDGAVQRLVAISGNPELLPAATQAVAQWRFRPFFHAGQPEEFTTRITVVFRLP
jgi:TonB family protein